jgi:hypothetical protein
MLSYIGQTALVKARSAHCKTAELPINACWKEDAQVLASKPQEEMAIESVRRFQPFCKALQLRHLWSQNFFSFRDKGLNNCILVVGICE